MTRALVTGGAGFVGSHVCDALVARGCDVVVLDDLSRGSEDWLPADVEVHRADVRDADTVFAIVQASQPDLIVHLAALHFIPAVDEAPRLATEINVEGTANLVAAARSVQPTAFVFASSAAVYPNCGEPIAESVQVGPIDLYGRTKVEGERLVASLAEQTGIRCVSARLFNVIGPRETNPHVVPEIVEQVAAGADVLALGNIATKRDYVNVLDVAAALTMLAFAPPTGHSIFNVGTGKGTSVAELAEICARICEREIVIETDPRRLRSVDRMHLVADVSALAASYGWRASRDVVSTLTDLLVTSIAGAS